VPQVRGLFFKKPIKLLKGIGPCMALPQCEHTVMLCLAEPLWPLSCAWLSSSSNSRRRVVCQDAVEWVTHGEGTW